MGILMRNTQENTNENTDENTNGNTTPFITFLAIVSLVLSKSLEQRLQFQREICGSKNSERDGHLCLFFSSKNKYHFSGLVLQNCT